MKQFVGVLISWGPFGIFFLAILDSAGIPLPAAVDALLVATAAVNPPSAYLDAMVAVIGSVIGCMILFYLGRKGGQTYLDRVTAEGNGAKFREWFETYGLITVFVPALLPIPLPLKVFVVSAGAMGVKPLSFLLVILGARVPRYLGLAYMGSLLGKDAMVWLKSHVWHLILFAVGLSLVLGYAARVISRLPKASEARRV